MMETCVSEEGWLDSADGTPPLQARTDTNVYFSTYHNEYKSMLRDVLDHEPEITDTITSDDILIVVDLQYDFLPGGKFAVNEGDAVVEPICALIERFVEKDAHVYCSRDYHPVHHCSFQEHGGNFPRHCVQGTRGSEFVAEMCQVIQHHLHPLTGPVFLCYKGFSPDVDSFGAMAYDSETLRTSPRVSQRIEGPHCDSSWTGSFLLFASNAVVDCNAPPDVMSVLYKRSIASHIAFQQSRRGGRRGRLFVVGLAMDYCVLDTAVNAASLNDSDSLFSEVIVLFDYCRAAHIAGFGPIGSGFLTDPFMVKEQIRTGCGVRLVETQVSEDEEAVIV